MEGPEWLTKQTVGDLVRSMKTVVTVDENTSLESTMKLLQEHQLLSVPVLRAGKSLEDKDAFLGMLNLRDIVSSIVFLPFFANMDTDHMSRENMDKSLAEIKAALKVKAKSLLGLTQESKFSRMFVFDAKDPASVLLQPFSSGLHRALVHGGKGKAAIVSQTDFLHYVIVAASSGEFPKLSTCLAHTLEDSKLEMAKPLTTIGHKSLALTAFRRMLRVRFYELLVWWNRWKVMPLIGCCRKSCMPCPL